MDEHFPLSLVHLMQKFLHQFSGVASRLGDTSCCKYRLTSLSLSLLLQLSLLCHLGSLSVVLLEA